MSNYKSKNLVDINLEVLSGCKWSCSGCNVNKTDINGFVDQDFERLMNLFEDLKINNHVLMNLSIGATDFMTARNSHEIFTENLIPMLDQFRNILLNTTFQSDKTTIQDWALKLKPILKGKRVKFAIPMEPEFLGNRQHIRLIKEKKEFFQSFLPETNFVVVNNVVNYYQFQKKFDPFVNYHEFSELFAQRWGAGHLDLVVSEGRLPLNILANRDKLQLMIRSLNKLFEKFVVDEKSSLVNFTYGKRYEGYYKDYIYKNGNLYMSVFLGEPMAIFEEDAGLGSTAEWNFKSIVDFENKTMLDSLEYMAQTTECMQCEYASNCLGRRLIYLMKKLDVKDCLAPKRGFKAVNDNFYKHKNFEF